jgi:hypothetical protein
VDGNEIFGGASGEETGPGKVTIGPFSCPRLTCWVRLEGIKTFGKLVVIVGPTLFRFREVSEDPSAKFDIFWRLEQI